MKIEKITLFFVIALVTTLLAACGGAEDRKAKYFERGMALFDEGNYVKAKLEFKNVLQIDPKHVEAYFMQGRIEEHEQNWPRAYALYLRATELDPKHDGALVRLGRIYVLSGEPAKALETAESALSADPDNLAARVLKGVAKSRLGDKEEALDEAKAALAMDPGNLEAVALLSALYADQGDLENAINLARQGLEKNPKSMSAHLLLARLYELSGDTEATVDLLEKMIELNPVALSQRVRLAGYHLNKGDKARAEQVLRDSVTELPDEVTAKLALVEFLNKNDKKQEAESELLGYIDQFPDELKLQLSLANLYQADGRGDAAEQVLRQLIERAPESLESVNARSRLASLLAGRKQTEAAAALIEEALLIDPKSKQALLLRAMLAMDGDDPDKGIADLRTILADDPGHVAALRLKARAHLQKKETALARESLEKVIQARPQEVSANFELAELLVRSGELDDAVVVLEKMRQFAPDEPRILQGIARIRIQQKDWNGLLDVANAVVEKQPGDPIGFYYTGLAQQGKKEYTASIESFEQALTIKPNAAEPLIALARSYLREKQPEEALQRVRAVLAATPQNYLAANLEGEILLSQKRNREAQAVFERAIEIKPDWSQPYKNLARTHALQGDHGATRATLQNGYAQTKDPALGLDLATVMQRFGDNDAAAALYRELLEKRPGLVLAANNLAMLLIEGSPDQVQLDEALELVRVFETANNPVLLDTLGWVYFQRGEMDKAISALERAVQSNRGNPEIDYHMARAYIEKNRTEEAKKRLENALATGRSFPQAEHAQALLKQL